MAERRIAIVGGGMAGLAAAFELTRTERLRERFHVTIYQLGWRLGGKCASGVDDVHGRNIEHGLHIWFGYYENTFGLLNAVYDEWRPPEGQAITSIHGAIKPVRLTPVGDGNPVHPDWYRARFPPNSSVPGRGEVQIDTWQSLVGLLKLAAGFSDSIVRADPNLGGLPLRLQIPAAAAAMPGALHVDDAQPHGPRLVIEAPAWLASIARSAEDVDARHAWYVRDDLEGIVGRLRDLARACGCDEIVALEDGKRVSQLIDIVAAFAAGITTDVLLRQAPVADLDRADFRAWLVRHGARRDSVDESAFVKALYDTMFQYPEGDRSRPLYGAGTAAQVVLRMLGTYAGALAWRPAAGTGSAVIAPLYEVLKQRGVSFRFFHKLVDVELSEGEDSLGGFRFDRQVEFVDSAREYVPVRMRNGLLSWGVAPDWSLIDGADELCKAGVDLESHWCTQKVETIRLVRGIDFDDAILAIPLGAFKRLNADPGPCAQLARRNARFRSMTERQRLVPSVSVQAWSTKTLAQLGWKGDSPAAVSGPDPLGIWADMTELLRYEKPVEAGSGPASLHYLCDVLRTDLYKCRIGDSGTPGRARTEARAVVAPWFGTPALGVWNGAASRGYFNWNILYVLRKRLVGDGRLEDQVVNSNVDPAACCVSSAPGTTAWRLKCDESGFAHLYLAGSWIDTGFNTECIETAVMSGMQAARAITGELRAIAGERFLHPELEDVSPCELVRGAFAWVFGIG